MKSLILKDMYNMIHNMKSLLLMLFVFLFITVPQGGAEAYVITCCILCAMMVVTTFNFDENAKWEKYAMIMPISRKDLVLSKFAVLLLFCLFGMVFGGVLGVAGGSVMGRFHILSLSEWRSFWPSVWQEWPSPFFLAVLSFLCSLNSEQKKPAR